MSNHLDFDQILDQAENGNDVRSVSGGTALATMRLEELFRESIQAENDAATARQLAAIDGLDAQISENLNMEHWAQQSVMALASRLDVSQFQANEWDWSRAQTELLPETRELFTNVDPAVALKIQCTALKLVLQRYMRQVRNGAPVRVAPAIKGARPALMLEG